MMKFAVNQQSGKKIAQKIWRKWLVKIQKELKLKDNLEVSIALVSGPTIRKFNRIYRRQDKVTDVLSFSERDYKSKPSKLSANYLGEIVICYSRACKQAKALGHSVNLELEMLLIHGFLHLLGYDHQKPKPKKVMQRLEEKILVR
ncbi:MAG: rRNA maturation RNase YbeY [Patescibacteria group bacterium]